MDRECTQNQLELKDWGKGGAKAVLPQIMKGLGPLQMKIKLKKKRCDSYKDKYH